MRTSIHIALLAGAAGIASAQDALVTFGFTDLNGSFTSNGAGTGSFNATSSFSPLLNTGGDVTRTESTADFDAGTFGLPGGGSFSLNLSIFDITAGGAGATGTFEIVDADGDRITGNVAGDWFFNPFGLAFFNASTDSITFEDNNLGQSNDSFFTGATGGQFNIADLDGLFNGGLSVLFLRSGGFQSSFSGTSVQADGLIIPAPASIALMGLGGLAATRRRR